MADSSVTANPGTGGAVFDTDDIGGEHIPLGKIVFGAFGTRTLVTSTEGLPVQNDDTDLEVVGAAAENAAAAGNPVLVGGRYDATPRTLGDGDVGGVALDADGAVHISDGGNSLTIDGSVTVSGTSLTDIETNTDFGAVVGGGLEATALRVTVASDSTGVITVDGSELTAIQNAVEIIDDWDETNRAAVNLIASQTGVTGGAGAVAANTPRVTLASDDPSVTALEIIDNAVHVDDAAFTLGTHSGVMMMGFAGTQSVNANDAGAIAMETDGSIHIHDGGNSITVDSTALTDIETNTDFGAVTGGGVEASALRVTLANDSTGVVAATQSGTWNITNVSGTVSLPTNAATETTLSTIDTNTTNIPNVIGTDGSTGPTNVLSVGGTTAGGVIQELAVDSNGNAQVDIVNTPTVNLSTTDNNVLDDIAAKLAPNTTNGHSFYLNQDTNAVASVKASAGTIYWIAAFSTDTTPVYLNLYDVASGSVTLGTTTPDLQFVIPSPGDANGGGFTINFGPLGIQFATAITVAAATTYDGSADPGANVVITNIGYE